MAGTDSLPVDRNKGDELLDVSWVLFAISTILIVGRESSKLFILRRVGPDDLLMLLAWCCTAIYTISIALSYQHGLGRHYQYLDLQDDLAALKWIYIGQGFCLFSLIFGRSSFNLYLISIMGKSKPMLRLCLLVTLVVSVVLNIALIAALYGKCGPSISKIINPVLTCYRPSALSRFSQFVGSVNVVTDAVLTIAPIALISRLNTTPKAKVGAIALLGLSSFAMAASIWRVVTIEIIFSRNLDFTWLTIPYLAASSVEQNIIIITSSVPALGPMIRYLKRRWSSASSTTSSRLASSRKSSGDSDELYHNLAMSLGMRVPHLGNHVTIVAGSQARDSEERILPLRNLAAIKTTVKTSVHVESDDHLSQTHTR
ncbi:integral membrane protein [Teratosphaeria destructans]|uniref:Integral membrane protein n=1 Tax=Teratosphaeria destructans TaxID=418781 RepID=A0A9W7SJZ8_9PEZI|nr:integral membrane protein [Teratosphaeria destructans]